MLHKLLLYCIFVAHVVELQAIQINLEKESLLSQKQLKDITNKLETIEGKSKAGTVEYKVFSNKTKQRIQTLEEVLYIDSYMYYRY